MNKKKTEKKSLFQKWADYLNKKRTSNIRPDLVQTYGEGINKIIIRLPKTVYEQMELVSLMDAMNDFPFDVELEKKFINKIIPYVSQFEGQPITAVEELGGYSDTYLLKIMYCDLLLRPLSQAAQEKTAQTILQILPKTSESEE